MRNYHEIVHNLKAQIRQDKVLGAILIGLPLILLVSGLGVFLDYEADCWRAARLSDLLSRAAPLAQQGRYEEARELILSKKTGSWARKIPFGQWYIDDVVLDPLVKSVEALQKGDFFRLEGFKESLWPYIWKKVPPGTMTPFEELIASKAKTIRAEIGAPYKSIIEQARPVIEGATSRISRPMVKGTVLVWDYEKGTISNDHCRLPERLKGTPRDPAITIFGIRKSIEVFEGAYREIIDKRLEGGSIREPITHGRVEMVVVYYPSMQEAGVVVLEQPNKFRGNMSARIPRGPGSPRSHLSGTRSGPEAIDVAKFIEDLPSR